MVNSQSSSIQSIESNETETLSVAKVTNKGIDAINSFKEKAKSAIRDVSQPQRSQFHVWSESSMRQLLVDNNVEIRGAANATRKTLVRICDDVFGSNAEFDHEAQIREKKYTVEDIVRIDRAARVIQKSFIASRRRMYEKKIQECNKRALGLQTRQEHYAPNENNIIYYENDSRSFYSTPHLDHIDDEQPLQCEAEGYAQSECVNDGHKQIETCPSPSAPLVDEEECRPKHGLTPSYEEDTVFHTPSSRANQAIDKFGSPRTPKWRSTLRRGKQELTPSYEEDEVFHTPSSRASQAIVRFGSPRTPKRSSTLRRVKQEKIDKELETEWRKPSWKYAKKFEAASRPHRAGREMKKYLMRDSLGRHCTEGGCGEQLDLWNEGKTSEFSQFGSGITNYFKFLKWCCWIMFILSLLHMPLLVINTFGKSVQYDSILATTTLGNLGGAGTVTHITIPGCDETTYQFEHCTISKNDLAIFYSLVDSLGTVIVILGWIWLRIYEKKEVEHLNRATVNVSDYTLRAQNISKYATEREVAVHFANLSGHAVSEVNLAFKNANEIKLYMKRGHLMGKRYDCLQRIRHEKGCGAAMGKDDTTKSKRLRKLMKERQNLTSQLTLRDIERTGKISPTPEVIEAFVTFETEEGFVVAMSRYQMTWIRSYFCFYPKDLLFKGNKLKVSQAPEPTTIIWENLEVAGFSRFLRKCITTLIASLAILLSIYFTFIARDFKIQTMQMSKPCPEFFFELTPNEQYSILQEDNNLSHCYCSTLQDKQRWDEPMCRSYMSSELKSSAMSYGAGFMVCFMNTFFTILMDKAGTFEKHQSLNDMEGSNMTRVFILKFINTGCLVLLYNLGWIQRLVRVRFDDPHNFDIDWYGTGGVNMIIVMVINIISPHIGSLLQYRSHRKKIRKLESNLTPDQETDDKIRIWYSQEELNAVHLGPPFRLNYRYTQLLVNFVICWMYALSIPVLPFIGAISFFLSYWIDKYLFCNFYRIPPKYSDDIGRICTNLIGFAILLHLFMSCWILGKNQVFIGHGSVQSTFVKTNVQLKETMLKKHIIPLELIAIAFVCGNLSIWICNAFSGTTMKCLRCISCSSGNKVKKLKAMMNKVQVEYSSAKDRNIIKGLASFNILQNEKYQKSFAISQEFAMSHNRLSSIRGLNTKEGELCFSDNSSNDMGCEEGEF